MKEITINPSIEYGFRFREFEKLLKANLEDMSLVITPEKVVTGRDVTTDELEIIRACEALARI